MNVLKTLIYFFKKNPIKIFLFLIFGFLFSLPYNSDKINVKVISPIYSFKVGNANYYTYLEDNKPLTILSQQAPDKNNKIFLKEINQDRSFFMFLIGGILVIIFIASFSNDHDINWEIERVILKHRLSNVESEMENNIYTYTYNGKLLIQTTYRLDKSSIKEALKSYLECPNLFPDYETKKQRRKRLLHDV